jgi:hypothetical protein
MIEPGDGRAAAERLRSLEALRGLLLCGAFAWQRLRSGALPDLREVVPSAR